MRTSSLLYLLVLATAAAAGAAAPTFQDLMRPDCLPDAQFGMRVESAAARAGALHVVTTGAELDFDTGRRSGTFRQRIGAAREVLRVEIAGGEPGACRLKHDGPGFAFAEFMSPRFDLRVNGDSLFMLHAREPLRLTLHGAIEPGFVASHRSSFGSGHVMFDERGGFGLYCSNPDVADGFDPFGGGSAASGSSQPADQAAPWRVASYDLPADAVLWISICPPKPYDWQRSAADQVVWHWSNTLGYPPDEVLARWADFGNIVLLQSEVMLWKDWNLAFEPRLGPIEFDRVRRAAHGLGLRFIVYTSPFYFLRGTDKQASAMNSFENFTNWPGGTGTGENIDLFLAEIDKVMKQYRPDGLYFDGQYEENPAALYLLARRARSIVGERGILEWHSTNALGPDFCSLPAADAYVDFILRGEGRELLHEDEQYLRYFVSGYNIHNSIGVLCNNGARPRPELARRLLDVNGRMHTLAGWLDDPTLVDLVHAYRRDLGNLDALRRRVEAGVERRQAAIPGQAKTNREEERMLRSPPNWTDPPRVAGFDTLAEWTPVVSPLNPDPFTAVDGKLIINARAHTFAYLERPLGRSVGGCVFKIRRRDDQGMSWGPAVCLGWADGSFLRVGMRSDGLIQADIAGEQRLAPASTQADQWLWLRVRWGGQRGILEQSADGDLFTPVIEFRHAGAYVAPVDRLMVGKVPYNGRPHDFAEPGPVGVSEVGSIELH